MLGGFMLFLVCNGTFRQPADHLFGSGVKASVVEMITAQEEKLRELDALYESSYAETEKTAELMDNVSKLYEELISFSDLYDSASFEAKKMIVSQLIRRVDVYRGYQIHVDFNFDLAQYLENSDELAC